MSPRARRANSKEKPWVSVALAIWLARVFAVSGAVDHFVKRRFGHGAPGRRVSNWPSGWALPSKVSPTRTDRPEMEKRDAPDPPGWGRPAARYQRAHTIHY